MTTDAAIHHSSPDFTDRVFSDNVLNDDTHNSNNKDDMSSLGLMRSLNHNNQHDQSSTTFSHSNSDHELNTNNQNNNNNGTDNENNRNNNNQNAIFNSFSFSLSGSPLITSYNNINNSNNNSNSKHSNNSGSKLSQRSPPLLYDTFSSPAFLSTLNNNNNNNNQYLHGGSNNNISNSHSKSPTIYHSIKRSPNLHPTSFFNSPITTPSLHSTQPNVLSSNAISSFLSTPSLTFALSSPQLPSTLYNSNNQNDNNNTTTTPTTSFTLPPRRSPRLPPASDKLNPLYTVTPSPLIKSSINNSVIFNNNILRSPSLPVFNSNNNNIQLLPPLHNSMLQSPNILPSNNTTTNERHSKISPKLSSSNQSDNSDNSDGSDSMNIEPHQPHNVRYARGKRGATQQQQQHDTSNDNINNDSLDNLDNDSIHSQELNVTSPTVLSSINSTNNNNTQQHHTAQSQQHHEPPHKTRKLSHRRTTKSHNNTLDTIDLAAISSTGSSCHQCKSRRSIDYLVFCRNMFINNSKQSIKLGNKPCRKKYCEACLLKFYGERPPHDRQNPQLSNWVCLSCRGICCCAACRRAKNKGGEDEQPYVYYNYMHHINNNNNNLNNNNNTLDQQQQNNNNQQQQQQLNVTTSDATSSLSSEALDLSAIKPANFVAYGLVHFNDWLHKDNKQTQNINIEQRMIEYMNYLKEQENKGITHEQQPSIKSDAIKKEPLQQRVLDTLS